jgi:hypothetical protein
MNWIITHDPKPIPSRDHDWDWHHTDYDGASDSGDNRCGTASSAADAIQQINRLTSPPQGHPQRITAWPILRDALGFVLVMAVCAAFVGLLGMQAGVW